MPGPGPRGPRQTYRTPCSSIPDSRISARNPRKTGKSRRARGTRTRQPGTRSTRDGLLCGEIASAAGGTRARAARSAPAAERNPAHGPRSPALELEQLTGLEALGPGIRSAGLDLCKFVPVSYPTLSHLAFLIRGPGISGHFASKNNPLPAIAARGPGSVPAGAWAMFLTNNPVKNDMDVSRETLPIF